jgi:hypothetical protein
MAKTVEVGLGLGSTDGNASGSGLGGSLKSSMEHEEGPIALPGSMGGSSEPVDGCSVGAGAGAPGSAQKQVVGASELGDGCPGSIGASVLSMQQHIDESGSGEFVPSCSEMEVALGFAGTESADGLVTVEAGEYEVGACSLTLPVGLE